MMINQTSLTLHRLDNLNNEQQRISYQMSSGKKIDDGSDDSVLFTRQIFVEDKIRTYEGIKEQLDKTVVHNNVADQSISQIKNLLDQIKSELIKANTDTVTEDAKQSIAVSIAGVKQNILDLANTKIDGEYLFSGSDSSVRPFTEIPGTKEVTYNGDNLLRKIAVSDGSYREKGVNGYDLMSVATDTATFSNRGLQFSADQKILDESGSEWKFTQALEGETLTFSSANTIADNSGTGWTLDTVTTPGSPYLENAAGDTIAATLVVDSASNPILDDLGNQQYTVTVPNSLESMRINELQQVDYEGKLTGQTLAISQKDTLIDSDNQKWAYIDHDNADGDNDATTGVDLDRVYKLDENMSVTTEYSAPSDISPYIKERNFEVTIPSYNGVKFEAKSSIFDLIQSSVDSLNGINSKGDPISDDEQQVRLSIALGDINKSFDAVNVAHAELGGRNKVFEVSSERVQANLTQFNVMFQEISAADLSKVAVEAKALELTFTALYSTINKTNELSLVNFIR